MFQAVTDYGGGDYPGCISLRQNDSLLQVCKLDDYWSTGTNQRTGENGMFPGSYVKSIVNGNEEVKGIRPDRTDPPTFDTKLGAPESRVTFDDSKCKDAHNRLESKLSHPIKNVKKGKVKLQASVSQDGSSTGTFHEAWDHKVGKKKLGFTASTEMLFRSERGENKAMKAVFGFAVGILMGPIMFVLFVYSFDYTMLEAGIVSGVATLVIAISLALSTFCRCIMALLFPNFFTGKGRAVFLSIIFGILLTKPITNITINAKETGSSLACITEMAVNQSRALQRQLSEPIKEISKYVEKQKKDLKSLTFTINDLPEKINSNLDSLQKAVDSTTDKVVQGCKNTFSSNSICSTMCSGLSFLSGKCTDVCSDATGSVSGLCTSVPLIQAKAEIIQATTIARLELEKLSNLLKVDLQVNTHFNASANSNKSLDTIQEEVNEDIVSKARTIHDILHVAKKFLSLSLLLMFFQSFWYIRNYLAKDAYDNVYITKEFVALDKQSAHPVLPLKKKERDIYVLTSSFKLGTSELSYCKLGLFQVLLHFILCFIVVSFDFALYYILSTVNKYSNVSVNAGGDSAFSVNVEGSGPVAEFYRTLVKGTEVNQSFNMSLDISICLPQPSTPSTSTIPVLLILYAVALAFVVLRGYGMRLRRKIAAYYYPEQERERLEYLHKKIRHKRVGFLKFLRQQIMSSHKESRVKDKLRFSTWLMFNFPVFEMCLKSQDQQECTSCEHKESSFGHHIKLTPCKGKSGGVSCDAVYCDECLQALNGVCPICSKNDVVLRE